jgi:hypothetical protein
MSNLSIYLSRPLQRIRAVHTSGRRYARRQTAASLANMPGEMGFREQVRPVHTKPQAAYVMTAQAQGKPCRVGAAVGPLMGVPTPAYRTYMAATNEHKGSLHDMYIIS